MEAYHFGSDDHQLFGVYSPPLSAWPKPVGVVICPPIGQEYMRTHRGLHSMGNALAREGLHVLRFDYYGTGDSMGMADEMTWESCRADIAEATSELMEISGASDIILLGMRLGASLALQHVAEGGAGNRLLLWDPIIRGSDHLVEVSKMSQIMTLDYDRFTNPKRANSARAEHEYMGHRFNPAMASSLTDLNLSQVIPEPSSCHVVLSPSVKNQPHMKQWQSSINVEPIDADEAHWSDYALVEVAYLPSATIPKAVKAVSQ